jgi:glutathione S-transferase
MTLKLHCFGESGNAYKAALTLTLCGLEWEPVFVDFFRGASRTPEYRDLNIMAEAPVLDLGDCRLSQSGVIQLWAAERTDRFLERARRTLRGYSSTTTRFSSMAGRTDASP